MNLSLKIIYILDKHLIVLDEKKFKKNPTQTVSFSHNL